MRIAVCGLGRLGRSLLELLPAAGHEVVPWRRGDAWPEADVYWLTVRDGAIAEVAAALPVDRLALHASGALPPEVLGERPERGVLHLLQSFPGPEQGLPSLVGVGAAIGGTPRARGVATAIARSLGVRPFDLPADGARYHAAACLAGGHVAGMFQAAVDTLIEAGVAPEDAPALLVPLARASLDRVAELGPVAITGPAARGDDATIERHRAVLGPLARALYDAGTAEIRAARGRRGGGR